MLWLRNYQTWQSILFNGVPDGVLYRQLLMCKPPNNGGGWIIDFSEITPFPAASFALITYPGSDSLQGQVHQGFNAEADECTTRYVPC